MDPVIRFQTLPDMLTQMETDKVRRDSQTRVLQGGKVFGDLITELPEL